MLWRALELTGSKAPTLSDNESHVYSEHNVGLYNGEEKAKNYMRGWAYLTTQRLCYVDDANPQVHSVYVNLSDISEIDFSGKFLRSNPKISLILKNSQVPTPAAPDTARSWVCPICTFPNQLPKTFVLGSSQLPTCENCGVQTTEQAIATALESVQTVGPVETTDVCDSTDDSSRPKDTAERICPLCTFHNHPSLINCEMCGTQLVHKPSESVKDLGERVKIVFRGGGSRLFFSKFQQALGITAVSGVPGTLGDRADDSESTPEPDVARTTKAFGIHSLESASSNKHEQSDTVMETAFEDLDALMTRAKEVVQLVEQYGAATPELARSLGLDTTGISKDMASDERVFHQQLARQIADFIETKHVLENEGGVMSLFDLFAVYNRARGFDLVSPNDLNAAMELAESIGLPIRQRTLKSGLRIVETKRYIPTQERLAAWLSKLDAWQADAGVTASDVSREFGWSLYIATEELGHAELEGTLCRDERPQGLRYFTNRIVGTLNS